MQRVDSAQRRRWADIVVIVVALWSVGEALWGPALLSQRSQDPGASTLWLIASIAGLMAIGGLFLTRNRLALGRGIIALAGLMHLVGPFAYRNAAPLPITFAILSGVLLLAAAWFVGPVPKPAGIPKS